MNLRRILVLTAALLLSASQLNAEYVFLKDGSIIEGRIVADSAASITVRLEDRTTQRISRSDIMRILYTEIYLGRVFVQKTDGRSVIAYMVDEDRESYTFRMELYEPAEFKLRRDEVLFMARGNPTGLQGEVTTDSIRLKWFAPYIPIRRYRVYVKGPGEREFALAAETGSTSYNLRNLTSNTRYQVYVTAIDRDGIESLPSNHLDASTLNIPPEPPEITLNELDEDGTINIAWNEALDPDGEVTGYRLYKILDGETEKIADIKNTRHTIKPGLEFDTLFLRSVDNMGDESDDARVFLGHTPWMSASIAPAYVYPAGQFGEIAGHGFGAEIRYEMSNYFLTRLEMAAEISFYYLTGRDDGFIEPESKTNYIILVPVMINAGYAFYPFDDLAVIPYLSAGAVYAVYDYSYFDIVKSEETTAADSALNPAFAIGVNMRYIYSYKTYFTLRTGYNIMFEDSANFSYLSLSLGAGRRF